MQIKNSGLFRPYSSELSTLNRLLDAAIIWLTLQGLWIAFQILNITDYHYLALVAIIFYLFLAEFRSLYRSSRLESYGDIALKIFTTWVIVGLAIISVAFATKSSELFSRLVIGSWLVLTPLLLTCERFSIYLILRRFRSKGGNTRSFAILGDKQSSGQLLLRIKTLPWTGLVHFKNYRQLDELIKDVHLYKIDYVFLSYSESQQEEIIKSINTLSDSTASIYLAPNILLADLIGSHWVTLGNMPMITINDHPFYGGHWFIKKLEDLMLGAMILILISPLLLVIAIGVKLSSPGPILFKQRRYGLNGEIIQVLKFRTMTAKDDGEVVIQATKNDVRVTPFGRFLRKTSLDELPQFINVIQGDMSIVGPRPHAISHNEHYRKLIAGYMQRHKVKPGITGWAQVNGFRGETDTVDKMKARVDHDLHYINHWSIWLDLKIIFLTIINGFTSKAAY